MSPDERAAVTTAFTSPGWATVHLGELLDILYAQPFMAKAPQ